MNPTPIPAEQFLTDSSSQVVIDVRSPGEFAAGHIPGAVNIPLFDDQQRSIVGTMYAKKGREVAVEKGLEFVGPKMADFVRQVKQLLDENQAQRSYIHCWRGGMRSQSFAWLLSTSGLQVEVLEGGYKAFRKLAHRHIDAQHSMVVLSGLTGAGKTEYLKLLADAGQQVIDLEGLANHRGSSFGALGLGDQPSTEQFENDLFVALRSLSTDRFFWVEDEGSRLGRVTVPSLFVKQIRCTPAVFLDVPKSRRLDNLIREYGDLDRDGLVHSTRGIEKRLGGQNMIETIDAIERGDLRRAADITLSYYDRSYLKAMSELPRELNVDLPTGDLRDEEVVERLIVLANDIVSGPMLL